MGLIQRYKDGQLPISESTFSLNRLQIGNCNQAEFDKESTATFTSTAQYHQKIN